MNQTTLPGASNALTMGILSIVGCFICCGPFAAIFSFIGISSANKAKRLYQENPGMYTGYENAKTGKVLSYVGLALSLIYLLFFILYFTVIVAFIMAAVSEGGY